ncbi:MAG: iron-siderophore ABC transporter substrate-binding protein [Deinococcota bacterium]
MKACLITLSFVLHTILSISFAQTCTSAERLFDHPVLATEPVCVPETIERVAVIDRLSFETLLALGIKPVASPEGYIRNHQIDFPYRAESVAGIVDIGSRGEVNLEALLEAAPDVIVASEFEDVSAFDAIAPTVQFRFNHSGEWLEVAALTAALVGQEEGYARLLNNYEARAQALTDALGDSPPVLSVVRVREDHIRLYVTDSFAGSVIADAAIPRPDSQDLTYVELAEQFNAQTFYRINREQLPLADGDIIVVFYTGSSEDIAQQAEARKAALEGDPLWNSLGAVQNSQVYDVGGYWIGSSFIAAHEILDDLFELVANVEPTIPNPFIEATE